MYRGRMLQTDAAGLSAQSNSNLYLFATNVSRVWTEVDNTYLQRAAACYPNPKAALFTV